jgi:hypothetical protein
VLLLLLLSLESRAVALPLRKPTLLLPVDCGRVDATEATDDPAKLSLRIVLRDDPPPATDPPA